MKKSNLIACLVTLTMFFASCASPQYLALPDKVSCPVIQNTCSFGIQNMDRKAKVENSNLIAHYKDFDVQYSIADGFILSFTIINNSDMDLLIDKSKCFVMYDGNATQLFKDVYMTGSTSFNDVTGANQISTSHGRVMMIIPSYSKWEPKLNETNLHTSKVPDFIMAEGLHHLTVYDNPEVVEFSFEYSFDKKQTKWGSSRNKVYVNTVNVKHKIMEVNRRPPYIDPSCLKKPISNNEYVSIQKNGEPDWSEVNRIKAINQQLYKKHNTMVIAGRIVGGILTLPTIVGAALFWMAASAGCYDHLPPE